MNTFQIIIKRVIDILLGSILFLLSLIIIVPVSFFIALEDGVPFLFKQQRVGKNGKCFDIYKLRSMKVKSSEMKNKEIVDPYSEWGNQVPDNFVFKKTNEENPNVTKVGSIIRKLSIDELPQFLNVIKGEMSLVGPRPEIPEIVKHYDKDQKKRLEVKPGITGIAQIKGRSELTHKEKIDYDVFYVENQKISMDFFILFKTIFGVFSKKGAV